MSAQPMPGDKVNRYTVIASVVYNDTDYETEFYTLLLLDDRPPYYHSVVAYLPDGASVWTFDQHEAFRNINPAVTDGYAQMGGDY